MSYLVLDGTPHLVASACGDCGALYFDRRNACARCFGQAFERRPLPNTGSVRSFTIVNRAAHGVKAPYCSVVVHLDDGGGFVKSNLVNVEADPQCVALNMRVRLTTWVAAVDDDGTEAHAFAYEPVGD